MLPVPQSTSFSGISRLARSMKFCPLQCIGMTCSRSNFFSSAIPLPDIQARGHQVKSADQGVDFLDACDVLRPPQRVDDAAMAAGGDHHQPAIAHPETGGLFMPMLVGYRLSRKLVGGEMVIVIGPGVQPRPS